MPLEERRVHLARAHGAVTLPADCIVVAAMNPCPCGMAGDPDRECTCPPARRAAYAARISGPLLDRFDLRVEAPRAAAHAAGGEPSAAVARVGSSQRVAVLAAGPLEVDRRGVARSSTGPWLASSCRVGVPTGRAGWRRPSRRSPASTGWPRSIWPRRSRSGERPDERRGGAAGGRGRGAGRDRRRCARSPCRRGTTGCCARPPSGSTRSVWCPGWPTSSPRRVACDVAEYTAELAARGIVCVARSDPGYPAPLRELPRSAACGLRDGRRGGAAAWRFPGGRSASSELAGPERRRSPWHAGWRHTRRAPGMSVVSGMALGVDAAGHLGALEAGGATIAVLGCGPDVAYPRTNAGLHRRILETGLVLSEYAPGTPPAPWRFPARNRLIAALCRRRPRRRGSGPLGRAHHRRPRARPRPRRAGRPRLGRIARRGGHERASEGRGRDDRERGRSRGVAWPRPALAGCAAGRGRRARRGGRRRPGAHRGAGRTARPAGPRAGSGALPARAGRLDRPRRGRAATWPSARTGSPGRG